MIPISIISGQNALRAYDDNGIAYGANPINEYVLIDTGQIPAEQSKIVDFTLLGYDVVLDSIWTLSNSANNATINIDIITPSMSSNEQLHSLVVNTQNNQNCCLALPFIVLDSRYRLRIKPTALVENVLIYGHRVHRIGYLGVTNNPV